jgi:hypothetical protein
VSGRGDPAVEGDRKRVQRRRRRDQAGKFGRYAHDKIFIVSDSTGPRTVLTGSTNFSITGLYVNANHVLVYDDRQIAATYADVFNEAWTTGVQAAPFAQSQWATKAFTFGGQGAAVPPFSVTFSPHQAAFADEILNGLVERINAEGKVSAPPVGTVFFAVMELSGTGAARNPVYTALNNIHTDTNTFSLGISDAPGGVSLYPVGAKTGVLVTGKPGATVLPPRSTRSRPSPATRSITSSSSAGSGAKTRLSTAVHRTWR